MVYGAEAVLPSDIRHDSPRVTAYIEADNETTWQDALDRLDEERDIAAARSAIYQQDLRRYHSRRVRTRTFQEGDLVLRLIQDQTNMHKLFGDLPTGSSSLSQSPSQNQNLSGRRFGASAHPRSD